MLSIIPLVLIGQIDDFKRELGNYKLTEKEKVKLYIELSEAYWQENIDSAKFYTNQAFVTSQKTQDSEMIAEGLMAKSAVAKYENQEDQALELLDKATILIQQHQIHSLEAKLYYKIGNCYSKKPDSAIKYLNKSLDLALAQHDQTLIIQNQIKSLLILIHQKRHIELAQLYDRLVPTLETTENFDGLMETYTYMSLAFRDLNEEEKSLLYCNKAIKLSNRVKNKKLIAFVFGALGSGVKSYFETFEKAEPFLQTSIKYAIKINDTQLLRTNKKANGYTTL